MAEQPALADSASNGMNPGAAAIPMAAANPMAGPFPEPMSSGQAVLNPYLSDQPIPETRPAKSAVSSSTV